MSTTANITKLETRAAKRVCVEPLGQAFLSALVGFLQPIIETYAPPSPTFSDTANNAVSEVFQNEGQLLLSALNGFVAGTVQCHMNMREGMSSPGIEHAMEAHSPEEIEKDFITLNLYRSPTSPVSVTLPSSLMEDLRHYVFNKMPIRLLAFDASGQNLQLIERNVILKHILRTASETVSSQHTSDISPAMEITDTKTFIQNVSPYAILSHTWILDTPGDVVFTDWEKRHLNSRGNSKIENFCAVAAINHGVTLGWMDTVCINKDSSSELDESIRSMYKWYRGANVCVAYLADTNHLTEIAQDSWFTRGWTLQELVAPRNIQFYNMEWDQLCSPDIGNSLNTRQTAIENQIKLATTITHDELLYFRNGQIDAIPMSRRMQLGANRQVTREEDMAYSMMGILDVDISIAYGEGSERAFARLVHIFLALKRYTLDVFNHAIGRNLIPTSIQQYAHRSPLFDKSFGFNSTDYASSLHTCQPEEPILMTHLRVRMQPVFICALRTSYLHGLGEHLLRLGPFANLNITSDVPSVTAGYATAYNPAFFKLVTRIRQYESDRDIITLAIMNVQYLEKDDFITMPTKIPALAFAIQGAFPPTIASKMGNKKATAQFRLLPVNHSVVFEWKGPEKIPKEDLEGHGMWLETIYL